MRLPKDPENWTSRHVDRAIKAAWHAFDRYENRVDFSKSQEVMNRLYEPYRRTRRDAVEVATYTGHRTKEANMLP